nr:hypothetical protein [Tanacetum cinerariifolium]
MLEACSTSQILIQAWFEAREVRSTVLKVSAVLVLYSSYGDEEICFLEEGRERGFSIDKVEYRTIIHSLCKKLNLKMPSAGRGVMTTDMVLAGVESKFKDVIENGRSLPKTQVVEGVTTLMPISSVKDKAKKRLEVKARSTLMMGIPNERQLKFNSIKDAKQLMEAIEKRFVNNAQAVNTALRVSTSGTQVNTANIDNLSDAIICAFLASQSSSPQLMAMLTMRDKRFLKKTERKLTIDGNDTIGFDKSNVECYNFHKKGHFAREFRAPRSQDTKHKESTRRTELVETPASTALVSCDGLGGYDWSN